MLKVIPALVYMVAASLLAGCFNDALLKANQQQLEQQQTQLNQLKQEVAALQTQHAPYSNPSVTPGSCDPNIMHEATRKGGERFAASDFSAALSYYQDALTACPNNAQAMSIWRPHMRQLVIARRRWRITDSPPMPAALTPMPTRCAMRARPYPGLEVDTRRWRR